jgi:putative ABC transport system ATP-binding protein
MQGKVPVHALRGIDIAIEEGELVSILGPSGSGKSTLLNMIGALDLPSKGEVIIGGKHISKMSKNQLAELRRKVGFVFQFFNLISRLTAFQNVELSMNIQKVSKLIRKQKTKEILEIVGLGDRIKHRPRELSGGEQQRVAIARALAQNPKYLLMDEPTGNVDTQTRDIIMNLVKKLNKEHNMTIIIVTHDPVIAKLTDRTMYLIDGKLVDPKKAKSSFTGVVNSDNKGDSIKNFKEGS